MLSLLSPYIVVPGNDVNHLTNVGIYLLEFFMQLCTKFKQSIPILKHVFLYHSRTCIFAIIQLFKDFSIHNLKN